MIAESIRRDLVIELVSVNTSESLHELFDVAEADFRRLKVASGRRKEVLLEIRKNLSNILDRGDGRRSWTLIQEGERIVDALLTRTVEA